MKAANSEAIAFFQAEWPLQSQVVNSVLQFAEAGYEVELFLLHVQPYVDLSELWKTDRVRIIDLSSPAVINSLSAEPVASWMHTFKERLKVILYTTLPFLPRLRAFMRTVSDRIRRSAYNPVQKVLQICWLLCGCETGLLPPDIVDKTLQLMEGKTYRCLIGVEKKGLIWAGQVAMKLRLPFLYYSLELYIEDYSHYEECRTLLFKRLRRSERKYHRKAAATIIQDPERAQALFRANGVPSLAEVFYVPVSLRGGLYKESSQLLHEMLGLGNDRKIILYFGMIWEERYVLEFVEAAQRLPKDWVLVLHGEGSDPTLNKIKKLDVQNKVVVSLKMVPSSDIQKVVASAHIGLAFYSPRTLNERLTAFSSEKMALYMQCGVPFVAFDYNGFRQVAEDCQCGVVVRGVAELPRAVDKIMIAHHQFRQGAFKAFSKYYDSTCNYSTLNEWIRCICNSGLTAR